MTDRKVELLVPAGSLEVLKVAVDYGADAVYIGGQAYGLRAKADNFSIDEMKEAAAYANAYAPEHLELNVEESDAAWMIEELVNYGSLFIGENTAEVFGDYASGTNHTLPTLSAAKYTGGVWVGTFLKVCTNQRLTPAAAQNMAPLVSRLARGEGLIAHAQAAEKRKEKK